MARIAVLIAPDRLTAEVQVGNGSAATPSDLQQAIAQAGVVHGLDAAAIAELGPRLHEPAFTARIVIARGTAPTAGADGRVDAPYPLQRQPGIARADGSIDWHERGLLHPAATGGQIGRLLAPTLGNAGRDVLGAELAPLPGKPAALRLGDGARFDSDGSGDVLATRDGAVFVQPGFLDVLPLWKHDGDVDLKSGNLHTHGSVQVGGDVTADSIVEADGDVVVQGAVLDATLKAGGSALIAQSVQGARAVVTAGVDLHLRHGTGAQLTAGGTLRAQDQLHHCRARAVAIECIGGRGAVVGGELRARTTIRLLQAGSNGGAPTLLAVGDLLDEADAQVRATAAAHRVERSMQKRGDARGKGGKFGRVATAAADEALARKLELAKKQRELLREAVVEVRGPVHAGVRIQFGQYVLTIQEPMASVRCRWDSEQALIVQEQP